MQIQKNSFEPVLIIRHAQSLQNSKKLQIRNELGEEDRQKLSRIPKYIQMKYSFEMLDAELSKHGIQQAYQAKQRLKQINVDVVIVSPLRRALKTCDIIFGHRQGIKFYVQPLLAQAFYAACDIGSQIQSSIKKYEHKFDFSKLRNTKDQPWYISNISNKKILQEINKGTNDIHKRTLQLMKHNDGLQTNQQVRNRCKLLKEQIKNYIKLSEKRVAIVGHYFIIRFLTGSTYNQQNLPIDGLQLWNAESIYHNFIF